MTRRRITLIALFALACSIVIAGTSLVYGICYGCWDNYFMDCPSTSNCTPFCVVSGSCYGEQYLNVDPYSSIQVCVDNRAYGDPDSECAFKEEILCGLVYPCVDGYIEYAQKCEGLSSCEPGQPTDVCQICGPEGVPTGSSKRAEECQSI